MTTVLLLGVWMSSFALGNFAGPTFAGFVVQTEGFRNTTIVFFALYVAMTVIDFIEYSSAVIKSRARDSAGYQQIE